MFRYVVYHWGKVEPEAGFRFEEKARQYRRLSSSPEALRIRDEQAGRWLPSQTQFQGDVPHRQSVA